MTPRPHSLVRRSAGALAAWALALACLAPPAAAAPLHEALAPIAPPPRSAFPAERIAQGANLAAIGNCSGCHTLRGAAPFAGGVPIPTPFGIVHGSNITPDVATGIGNWSEAAFVRAMREGVSRSGENLYPAFPYDHFRIGRAQDLQALYAFVMTRTPVRAVPPANTLRFPFNQRALLSTWKLLYLRGEVYRDDPSRDAAWNRGAYLTQGLAHCGACHTPRNALGAERRTAAFAGGEAEGWYAPPLDADTPSPVPWTVDNMAQYLRQGIAPRHAIAGGPMQGVVASLARAEPGDVRAIATYIVSLMGPETAQRTVRAQESLQRAERPLAQPQGSGDRDAAGNDVLRLGAAVYAGACAACHDRGRHAGSDSGLRMPLAVALYESDPRSFLRIVREGVMPPDGEVGRWMPAFGESLSDAQLQALAAYLRRDAAALPPWQELGRAVVETRR